MTENDDRKKFDWSAWGRLAIYIATTALAIGVYKGSVDGHIANREIHLTHTELANVFVLRREYDSNVAALREDIRWVKTELVRMSDKLDRLTERNGK